MSEFAFDLNGEPFEVPGTATSWRVRRLKPRGAPEVVYGREGTPLMLPIDADMDDLRREARTEGRYRLDPIDVDNRAIASAPAGYVCIHPSEPTVEPAPPARPVSPGVDHVLIEAMRVNSELARAIVDKFSMMLESAAVLLRAADNAGMPARPPRLIEASEASDDSTDDEADTEEAPPKASGLTGLIETVLAAAAPAIVSAVVGGKLEIPGGVGALMDCRRASPKARAAAAARATSSPGVEPAPGPPDPAPVTSAAPPPSGARAPADATRASAPTATAAEPPSDLATLDPAALAHFAAIQTALTFREGMLARALAAELTPAELRTWLAELRTLSVAEAVAKIRGVLGADASEPPLSAGLPGSAESTNGGAS